MTWSSRLFDLLAFASAASAIVLAMGTLAALSSRRPATRIRVVLWTLIGCLAAPLAGLLPGYPHLSIMKAPSDATSSFNTEPTATTASFNPTDVAPSTNDHRVALPIVTSPSRIHRDISSPIWDWRQTIVVAWLAGLSLSVAWWLLGLFNLLRLLRIATPAPVETVAALTKIAGAKTGIRLLVSDRINQPIACWWGRPTIVLPLPNDDVASDHLDWRLAHEWAHLEHGDAIAWLFASAARSLLFHQPLIWLLCRRLRFDQDLLADAAAAQRGESPADYASFLLAHARAPFTAAAQLALGMAADRTQLYRRVVMLLHHPQKLERTVTWKARLAIALIAIGSVIAAGALPLPQSIRGTRQGAPNLAAQDAASETVKADASTSAEESTTNPAAPKTPREKLRYAGKSFDNWKEVLETDLEPKTRVEAINALASFGAKGYGDEVDDILEEVLASSDDESVHSAAIQACAKLGPHGFDTARAGIKSSHEGIRRLAIDSLAGFEAVESLPLLLELTNSHERRVRSHACQLIAGFGAESESAEPRLVELAQKDEDENVRVLSCLALGKLGKLDETTSAALITAIDNDTWPVAASAATALVNHGIADDRVKKALIGGFFAEQNPGVEAGRWRLTQLPKSDVVAEVVVSVLEQLPRRGSAANTEFLTANLLDWLVAYGPKESHSPVLIKWLGVNRSGLLAAEGLVKIGVTDQATKDKIARFAEVAWAQPGGEEAPRWRAVLKKLKQ